MSKAYVSLFGSGGDVLPFSDTTPPTLSNPSDGTPTADGATGPSVDTNEGNGTLYWAVLTNGGSCTDAQLKAGSGGNIVAGRAGSQAVSGTGTQVTADITGLSSATDYEIVWLHRDAAGNDSAQATVGLTTAAGADITVVDYQESTFSDSGTADELAGSVSWQTGDIILVFGGISNNDSGDTLGVPTVSGLSFSQLAAVNVNAGSDDATVYLWSATAAGNGSGQIGSVTGTANAATRCGIAVLVYRGAGSLGTPVTLDGSTAKTISVTRAGANSHVALMMVDWAQVGDVVVDATPTGTVRHASAQSGQADFFVVTFGDQGASGGPTAYGITNHTGTVDMSGIAVEIAV
jgi:hypothetical protein